MLDCFTPEYSTFIIAFWKKGRAAVMYSIISYCNFLPLYICRHSANEPFNNETWTRNPSHFLSHGGNKRTRKIKKKYNYNQ